MKIRKIKKIDLPFLVEIIFNYKSKQNPNLDNKIKLNINDTLKKIIRQKKSKTLISLNDEDKITGFINFHEILFPMITGKEFYISDLLIDENERGKNIGRKLVEEVEKIAKKDGIKRLMLNNLKESESYSRGFYNKIGFKERNNCSNFVKEIL
jgi:ribosomal protein S18 acetylase RimI-like enzyme